MSIDAIAAIILIFVLGIGLLLKRRKLEVQRALFPLLYVVMYRSTIGIKAMERLAVRFPRLLRILGHVGTVVGFAGMAFIVIELVAGSVMLFTNPSAVAGVQPVLPIEAKGVFFVPFLYWVISIFLIASVHEFAHGVLSFVHKIPVKRSGFAFVCLFLPIIPAAFVEPDEEVLRRAKKKKQLAVFAAGPFSNGLFAVLSLLLFVAISPLISASFESQGVQLVSVDKDGPAFAAGLRDGMILTGINNNSVMSNANMSSVLAKKHPGDDVVLRAQDELFQVTLAANPKNVSRAFLGIQVKDHVMLKESFTAKYGVQLPKFAKWLAGLFFWLFMLNIGIGLFNLLPLGPLDGGRMFELACVKVLGKKNGLKVWSAMSLFLIGLILLNLVAGFVR